MVYLIYGISDCPACLRACADLMSSDYEYVFVNCDFSKSFRAHLKDRFNWPTFPIVIRQSPLENIVIGGYDQLKDHMASLDAI